MNDVLRADAVSPERSRFLSTFTSLGLNLSRIPAFGKNSLFAFGTFRHL